MDNAKLKRVCEMKCDGCGEEFSADRAVYGRCPYCGSTNINDNPDYGGDEEQL